MPKPTAAEIVENHHIAAGQRARERLANIGQITRSSIAPSSSIGAIDPSWHCAAT